MDLKTDNLNSTALLSPEVVCEEQVSSFYANDNYENKEQVGKTSKLDKKAAVRPSLEETVHIENRLILNDDYLSNSMADGLSKRNPGRGTEKHIDFSFQFNKECDTPHPSRHHDQVVDKTGHGSSSSTSSSSSSSQNALAGRWSLEHQPAVQRETVICSGERKSYVGKSNKQSLDQVNDDGYSHVERFSSERHQGFARELDQIFSSSKESGESLVKSSRYKQTLARGIDQNRSEVNDEVFRPRKTDYTQDHRQRREEEPSHHDVNPVVENISHKPYRSQSPMHISASERPIVEGKFHKQTIEDIIRGKERASGGMHIQIEERRVTVNVSPPENDYKCFTRSDLSRSPVPPAQFIPTNLLRMPSPQMSYPPFLQAQNQGDNNIRLKGKSEQIFAPQGYPFSIDPRFYDGGQYSHGNVGKPHQFQESLSVDVSPSGQNRSTSLHAADGHGYQRPQLLQIPRPMALGGDFRPNFVPHPSIHLQGATPSSEEGNTSSPAGSSPFTEYSAVSPKSDDSSRNAGRGKPKQKIEGSNQCSQCMKTFSSSSALAKHKLIHSDERKYVCQICSKGFKRQDHLNGHMITHRDKKPYQCHLPDCDKSYCDMRSLRRHLENHHAVGTVASSSGVSPIPAAALSSGSSTVTAKTIYPESLDTNGHKERNKVLSEDSSLHNHLSRPNEEKGNPYNTGNSYEEMCNARIPSPREPRVEGGSSTIMDRSTAGRGPPSPEVGYSSRRTEEDSQSINSSNKLDDRPKLIPSERIEKQEQKWRVEDHEKSVPTLSRPASSTNYPWPVSQPYFVQTQNHYMNQQGPPWSSTGHNAPPNFKSMGQNGMPFLLGIRHQRFHSPVNFPGDQPGHSLSDPSNGKSQENGDSRHAMPHSNLHPNTLQMFNHTLAGQQNGMQSEMYVRPGSLPYFPGHHAIGRPTNPTAIAVAAAKDTSLYSMFQGRDSYYGAHPAVAQWQPVMQDDSVTYEREPVRDVFSTTKSEKSPESVAVVPTISEELTEPQEKRVDYVQKHQEHVEVPKPASVPPVEPERASPKMSTLEVNVSVSKVGSPCGAAVSPGRKQKPHPGPIIIPSAVNNKVTHSVTFSKPSSARPISPLRMGSLHGFAKTPPFYTPPPMLSPRSIFFTGACTTPRSGQMPSTPSRLLLSARRFSTTTEVKEEDGEQVFPEPKINVGSQFQAVVTDDIAPKEEAEKDVHKATLMWMPLREEKYKNREVDSFFEMASSLSLYGGADNKEYASHLLHKTRGNIKDAVRLLLSRRHVLRADDPNADYHYTGATRWSAKERLAFRQAFRSKGKDFHQIQKEIGTKSVKQCVEFYYLWKAVHPEGFRARTRYVEQESEQEEEEAQTPGVFIPSLTPIKEAVFECNYPECRARFVSRQALNGHIRVHGGSLSKPLDARKPRTKPTDLFGVGDSEDFTPLAKKAKTVDRNVQRPLPAFKPDGTALQFACKVCGRVFNKVKSRSAHMKTHVKKPVDKDKHKVHKVVTLVAHA